MESSATLLNRGTFNSLYRYDTYLLKRYHRLHHLNQELAILTSLDLIGERAYSEHIRSVGADYIIKVQAVDIENLTLKFPYYDMTLKELYNVGNLDLLTKLKIIEQVLIGLSHIHKCGFIHNNFKASNIFVRTSDYSVVLGISPITNVPELAEYNRTPDLYREPEIHNDSSHDMYSVGVWLLQFLGDITLNRVPSSHGELQTAIDRVITNEEHRALISNLVGNKDRYTADQVLQILVPDPIKEPES